MRFDLGSDSVVFTQDASNPAGRNLEFYQAIDRTAAGTLQVETLGISVESRELVFDAMPLVDYTAVKTFLEDVAVGAANAFLFTDELDDEYSVRCTSSFFNASEFHVGRFAVTMTLEYV